MTVPGSRSHGMLRLPERGTASLRPRRAKVGGLGTSLRPMATARTEPRAENDRVQAVKVRIGIGTGTSVMSGDELGQIVEDVESTGFDSLWWSDVLTVPGDDPLAAMAYAAGHGQRLKIGTTMVLPGRNPVRLAKQLATLDRLSGGRLLVTFVLGLRLAAELDAMGVGAGDRGRQLDEMLPLLRRLWTENGVDHEGESWKLHGVTVEPKPLQHPFDVWLGGSAPGALRRVGTLGDGWLPALCTPEEAAAGRRVIEEAAAEAGRRIDPEHFGVSIGYVRGEPPEQLLRRVRGPATGPGELAGHDRGRRPRARRRGGAAPAHREIPRRRVLQVRGAPGDPPDVVSRGAQGTRRRGARPADLMRWSSPSRGMLRPSRGDTPEGDTPEGDIPEATFPSDGGAMGKARAEIDINRPADAVWAVVGDFGGIGAWMPGIESCDLDGDDRVLKMMGMEIIERLERRDDEARELIYGIVGGVPVINHKATITVVPEGTQSHVTWDVDVDDEMTDMMHQVYQQSLQALKDHLSG